MGGRYGMSNAATLMEQGRWDEAVAEANLAVEREPEEAEHRLDRAGALVMLARYTDAVTDVERALALDAEEDILDPDVVDDVCFEAFLGAARLEAERSVDAGIALLERYRALVPSGRHQDEAVRWGKRLRGELKDEFVKRRAEDI